MDEEYDPKRALRAAKMRRPDPVPATGFTIRDAELADMPHCRAIYNYYVENSTVTFDEERLTHAQYRAKYAKALKNGWPWIETAESSLVVSTTEPIWRYEIMLTCVTEVPSSN